jgi:aspartyl protease family protein
MHSTTGAVIADYRHSMASALFTLLLPLLLGLAFSAGAAATDVTVAGLFPNKAVVQIDGGTLQTLSVGQKTSTGVTLVSVDRDSATFDIQGKRATLRMGQLHVSRSTSSAASVVLNADARGHFVADVQINGAPVRFIVDTGATVISIPVSEARRMALDFRKGQMVVMNTANGTTPAYRIKLDTVRVGDVSVNNVDAVVMEAASLQSALLGMSFLKRMDMKREGDTMTLTKRY